MATNHQAKTLELDLLAQPFFGDAHAEAWHGSTINPVQRFAERLTLVPHTGS
jgi:hypothetical protein